MNAGSPSKTSHTRQFRPAWPAILGLLLVCVMALPAIFAYPAERVLFNAGSYKSALVTQRVYDRYPEILSDLLARQIETVLPGSGRLFERMLNRAGYQDSVLQIFPSEWAQGQTESLVDQLLAYFNLETPEMVLVVDFRPVKQRLRGEVGTEIARTIVSGFPSCSAEELLIFGLNVLQGQVSDVPLCRPPDQFLEVSTSIVQGVLQVSASALPNQADFARILRLPLLLGGQRLEAVLGGWFGFYRAFRTAGPWLPLAAAISLALTTALARGTRRGAFFWSGLALLVPGLSGLVMALFIRLFAGPGAAGLLRRIFAEDLLVSELLLNVYREVMGAFAFTAALTALALVIAGAVLLAWPVVNRNRREPGADS